VRPWDVGPLIAVVAMIATWFGRLITGTSDRVRLPAFFEPFGASYIAEPDPLFPIACGIALGALAFAAAKQRSSWHAGFAVTMVATVALAFSTIVLEYATSYTASRYYRGVLAGRRSVISLMDPFGRKRLRSRVVETAYRCPIIWRAR